MANPGGGASAGPSGGGGGGGGGGSSISEATIAPCEWLSSVTGTNTITAVTATPYSALVAGFQVRIVPANTNSGAVTLNVNSIGAKAVTRNGTTALAGGELRAGRFYLLEYDGTRWQIIGPSFPISALVLASDANGNPAAATLADGKIWIGQGTGLPAAETVSGDATLADTGVLTLATVNTSLANPYGDGTHVGQFVVNGKGQITSAANVPITFPALGYVQGSGQFVAGQKTIASGFTTVTCAICTLVSASTGFAELVAAGGISGGSITFSSSNPASTSFFYYVIFGS